MPYIFSLELLHNQHDGICNICRKSKKKVLSTLNMLNLTMSKIELF